jgi:DNA-binding LacI/PurR family transcriptional regulator
VEPVPSTGYRRSPNIRDVAREAGVGVATVSRVLNDSPRVSQATHQRVRQAIESLGYRRNMSARSLSLGRSHAIGVLAPFFTQPSVAERLRGISATLAAAGYDLLLFDVETVDQRADALDSFARADRVDGLLVVSLPLTDAEIDGLRRDGLSTVMVDVAHPALPHIAIDDIKGGRLAARHLIGRGHTRLGFVGDEPSNPFGFRSSERRREGFREAAVGASVVEATGEHGREGARELARVMLRRRVDRPTAIFAASDIQAVGVIVAARDRGLRVPDDVAVVGFDDIELASVLGLTTVRQPLYAAGAMAAGLLLTQLGAQPPPRVDLEPLRVIQRLTT